MALKLSYNAITSINKLLGFNIQADINQESIIVSQFYMKRSKSDNRIIAQETIILLRKALNSNNECLSRREKILKNIKNIDLSDRVNFPDPVKLIRTDGEK